MSLVLNEEQSYLKDTARDFAKNKTPVSHFRGKKNNQKQTLSTLKQTPA
jgi:hypothetical protein